MVVLSKWGLVRHGRQVNWITDRLSNNKWPKNHFEGEMAGDDG
jgi:hypothetical protein